MTNTPDLHCTFCKKSSNDVASLLSGPANLCICDECLACLVDILARQNEAWRDQQIEVLTKLRSIPSANSK
jgi:ATP-dependent protease Clp ATPase subunit